MIAFLGSAACRRMRTNNHVERINRKLRHEEKARYKSAEPADDRAVPGVAAGPLLGTRKGIAKPLAGPDGFTRTQAGCVQDDAEASRHLKHGPGLSGLARSVSFSPNYWASLIEPEFYGEWAGYFGYIGQASWFASAGCGIAAARHEMKGTGSTPSNRYLEAGSGGSTGIGAHRSILELGEMDSRGRQTFPRVAGRMRKRPAYWRRSGNSWTSRQGPTSSESKSESEKRRTSSPRTDSRRKARIPTIPPTLNCPARPRPGGSRGVSGSLPTVDYFLLPS